MYYQYLRTPVGTLRLVSDNQHLIKIEFEHQYSEDRAAAKNNPVLSACTDQLSQYFSGLRQCFSLPFAATGTAFQQSVWGALAGIPYGEIRTYRDIAGMLGKPTATRAVGAAGGRNPLPILIPCHRMIGSNGKLTGFSGGLANKKILLELEKH